MKTELKIANERILELENQVKNLLLNLPVSDNKNIVKKIRTHKLLGKMLKENLPLYEQILDSNISYYFNQIVKLAMQ